MTIRIIESKSYHRAHGAGGGPLRPSRRARQTAAAAACRPALSSPEIRNACATPIAGVPTLIPTRRVNPLLLAVAAPIKHWPLAVRREAIDALPPLQHKVPVVVWRKLKLVDEIADRHRA